MPRCVTRPPSRATCSSAVPVIAIADIFGISGRRRELKALLGRTEQEARGVPGSRRYTFAATVEDPDHFVLVGEWDTHAAMDAHHRSEAFARYQFELGGLLARPSEMTVYSVAGAVRPVPSGQLDPRDAD
jgi:quinol monooxygenase YgiN